MAQKKVTDLTALGAAPATNDLVPMVDVSDTADAATGTTKSMTVANLFATSADVKIAGALSADTTVATPAKALTLDGSATAGAITQSPMIGLGAGSAADAAGYGALYNTVLIQTKTSTASAEAIANINLVNKRDGTSADTQIAFGVTTDNLINLYDFNGGYVRPNDVKWYSIHEDDVTPANSSEASIRLQGTSGAALATVAGNIAMPSYLSTRDNTGASTPVNFLYTDSSGNMKAGALNAAATRTALGLGSIATINSPVPVANGGTATSSASITAFNNITGYTASGATGTTSTNLVFSASPTFTGTVALPTSVTINGNAQTFPTTAATLARTDAAQSFTGVQTFVAPILGTPTSATLTNATGLPIGGLSWYTAPTTTDSNADAIFGASAAGKKAFVIQAKATPTQPPFEVQGSNGTPWFSVQTDGNVIIDQRTAATATNVLQVKYLGTPQFVVGTNGDVAPTGDVTMATTKVITWSGNGKDNYQYRTGAALKTLTESTATAFAIVTMASGSYASGTLRYAIEASDATDFQVRAGLIPWSAVNKAGTITASIGDPTVPGVASVTDNGGFESVTVSSGTLTNAMTLVDGGSGALTFKANAVSSLTQTTLRIRHFLTVDQVLTVTPQ